MKLQILLLEDDENDLFLIKRALNRMKFDISTHQVSTLEAFEKSLYKWKPDLVLSDYNMMGFTGVDAFKILKRDFSHIPFILVSGTIGEEKAVEVIQYGVWDFVSKNNLKRLESSITICLQKAETRLKLRTSRAKVDEYQKRLDLSLKGAALRIWEWDIEEDIVLFNSTVSDSIGYENEQSNIITTTWEAIVHPEDIQLTRRKLQKFQSSSEEMFSVTHRVKNDIGEWVWVLDRGRINSRGNKEKVRMLGVRIDIEDQKKTENKLLESNRRFKDLIENLPGVVYRVERKKKKKITFLSSSWANVFGYNSESFMKNHKCFSNIIHEKDRTSRIEAIEKAVENKTNYHISSRFIHENGSIVWVLEQGKPIFSKKGKFLAVEGYIYDVTEIKKAENKVVSSILNTEDSERKRMATMLEDNLSQYLNASFMNMEIVRMEKDALSDNVSEKLDLARDFLKNAIDETRVLAYDLMPKSINDFGYVPTIVKTIEGINKNGGVVIKFFHNLTERLDKTVEVNLFRITQEAINNILNYSKATEGIIQLTKYSDKLVLSVEDNGLGFDFHHPKIRLGINSMNNRTKAISGSFWIDHVDEELMSGTQIIIEVPV